MIITLILPDTIVEIARLMMITKKGPSSVPYNIPHTTGSIFQPHIVPYSL